MLLHHLCQKRSFHQSSFLRGQYVIDRKIRDPSWKKVFMIVNRSFARKKGLITTSSFPDIQFHQKENNPLPPTESSPISKFKPAIEQEYPADFTINPLTGIETLQELDADDFDLPPHNEGVEIGDDGLSLPEDIEIGRYLLPFINSHYRHRDLLPDWFLTKQKEMTQSRSLTQIRRSLKSWMIKTELDEMKTYLNRPFHWEMVNTKKPQHKIPSRLIKYLYGPDETIAYAYYHLPSRYIITTKLFEDLQFYTKGLYTPKRILDYGCGPGTVAAALATVWPDDAKNMYYTGIEISQSMIDAANVMIDDLMPNATFWTRTSDVISRCLEKGDRYDCIVCSYTLTELLNDETKRVAVQVLYELLEPNGYLLFLENGNPYGSHTIRTARQYLIRMTHSVDRDGSFEVYQEERIHEETQFSDDHLLDGEEESDGDREHDDEDYDNEKYDTDEDDEEKQELNYSPLLGEKPLTLKQKILKTAKKNTKKSKPMKQLMILPPPKSYAYNEMKVKVIAPCTHDEVCPLKKEQWCSFSQKVVGGAIRKDSEEKYSYVMMQKVVNKSRMNPPSSSTNTRKSFPVIPTAAWLQKIENTLDATTTTTTTADAITGTGENPSQSSSPASSSSSLSAEELSKLTPLQILNRYIDLTEKKKPKETKKMLDSLETVDWDNYSPPAVRYEYGRLVRAPMKEKGHVILDICSSNGQLMRYTHSKAMLQYFPHLYRGIRKASWGGLIPVFMANKVNNNQAEEKKKEREAAAMTKAKVPPISSKKVLYSSKEKRKGRQMDDYDDDDEEDDDDYDEEDEDEDDLDDELNEEERKYFEEEARISRYRNKGKEQVKFRNNMKEEEAEEDFEENENLRRAFSKAKEEFARKDPRERAKILKQLGITNESELFDDDDDNDGDDRRSSNIGRIQEKENLQPGRRKRLSAFKRNKREE